MTLPSRSSESSCGDSQRRSPSEPQRKERRVLALSTHTQGTGKKAVGEVEDSHWPGARSWRVPV